MSENMNMDTTESVPRGISSIVYREMGEGGVLYNPASETYFSLNEVAAVVWALLPPVSAGFAEVVDGVIARFPDAPRDLVTSDVTELLQTLHDAGLVTYESEA